MSTIIGFLGSAQSGKTTSSNFIHGYELERLGIIDRFYLNDQGQLIVNAIYEDENGKKYEDMGRLDLDQDNNVFNNYASSTFWPHIKAYNFAKPIKDICMKLFGLTYEQCYGSDEDKNGLTSIRWEDIPGYDELDVIEGMAGISTLKTGYLTARELMQIFGTTICRKMKDSVWLDVCLNLIKDDNPDLAIIGDVRFENEIERIHSVGGRVIYLNRNSNLSKDQSEQAHRIAHLCDYSLDNKDMSIQEQCDALYSLLTSNNLLKKRV